MKGGLPVRVRHGRRPAASASWPRPSCDIGNVGYQMALLVERAGEMLTPELVDELKNLVLVR